MIGSLFTRPESEFAHRVYTSYLWCSNPEDMYNTVVELMDQADEFGIELDYNRFGIMNE